MIRNGQMIEGKLTCPDALSTLIFFNGWLGFESLETDDDSPSKDELLSRRLVVMKIRTLHSHIT